MVAAINADHHQLAQKLRQTHASIERNTIKLILRVVVDADLDLCRQLAERAAHSSSCHAVTYLSFIPRFGPRQSHQPCNFSPPFLRLMVLPCRYFGAGFTESAFSAS